MAYCSLLNVSIATTRIRRCFNNTYWLNWQNFGTADAENVQIDVVLPPELDFVSANPLQPIVIGDTLRFSPGTVPYGASGSLSLVVHADCDSTILGQTLCVEAWIRPDTLCYDIPNWSGAEVVANARCTSDTTIQYTLKNVGNGPTGDLNYIITEDLVVLMTQPFNLNPNQEIQINQPFSGNLQRIIAEQAPNYPFDPVSAAAVETCGGSTNGLGQINQFPLTDGSPFVDISCSTVVSSFDPNDKTGFPLGYGTDHLLEANTDITYLIRFQNTGTDTAFRVVVRDTLSQWLDVASVQPGPASHPYRWNFEDGNVLAFHFDPIALPDSNVNQDASNGFIQFRIKQKPNLADGTEILNTADIYFDYNAPVRTNTTLHRIGKFEYTVSVFPEPAVSAMSVTVSPNPFSTQTTLRLGRLQDGDLSFELYDQQGRLMRSAAFKGGQYELSAEGLHAGMYTYALKDARGAVQGRGKIIVSSK
ncbi:MAG: T9SS type A sorting domain-containing protein [Bacteroidota bacterium]